MNPAMPNPHGWFDPLRRIGASLSALLRNRLELFTVEWQEEKLRLLNLLLWCGLAAAIGGAGVLVAIFTLALWLWATAGYAGLIGLAVTALAVAAGIFWAVRRKIQSGRLPFAQTVAEFRKDGECLHRDN